MNERFNEMLALRSQRSLYEQFRGAFAAMTIEMKNDAVERFTAEFTHPNRDEKFKLVKVGA